MISWYVYTKTKIAPFLLAFLFFADIVSAQEKELILADLRTHTQNDTTRVRLLFELSGQYIETNIDSMELIAQEGLSISENIHYERGIGSCSRRMGLVALRKHEFDKALQYYQAALEIYEKIHDKATQAEILIYMGDIEYRDTKYSKAIEYYNQAIKVSREIGDLKDEGLALIDIGGIYSDEGSYPEAINFYLKGLRAAEKQNDSKGMSMALVNVATIYSAMGNYKLAVEYINKSLPITKGISDREVIFSNMINVGVVYGQMKDYKNCLAAFENGLVIADSMNDITFINACLGNIADVYYQMGEYDTSLAKYAVLLKQNEKLNDTSVIIIGKTGIGANLIKKGKIKDGINELLQALEITKRKQMKQNIFDVSVDLSNAYEQLRDASKALEYYKIAYVYRDSLNNDKIDKKIQQLDFDYELGKKETEIELLNKNKLIEHSKNQQQRLIIWASLSGLGLLLIISILLYRNSQREKRNKEKILKQKEEIQLQASRLEELNRFKDKTFSVLSHDLRGPVGSLTSAMSMLDENVMTQADFMTFKPDVQNQLHAVSALLDNLLNWAKGYMHGETAKNPEKMDMHDIVQHNIKLSQDAAGRKKIKIHNNIPPSTTVLGYPGQIDIVIRNLMMNSIKFSNNNGAITFSAKPLAGRAQITITDEGIGMTEAQLNKLFTVSADNSTYGTGGEKGIGIGLLLCYEFIKANNGTISASSEVNKGTVFTIVLPAPKH